MPRLRCEDAIGTLERIRIYFGMFQDKLKEYEISGDEMAAWWMSNYKRTIEADLRKLRENLNGVSFDKAREILGKDFLGQEAIEKTFNLQLKQRNIPVIPFTETDLKQAKDLGQYLILHIKKGRDGEPLTMERMTKLNKIKHGIKNMHDTCNDAGRSYYTKEVPMTGWSLVSKEAIPHSTNKDYLQQTELVVEYLEKIFSHQEMPEVYRTAIQEFQENKADLASKLKGNWGAADFLISKLQINELTGLSAVDVMYNLFVYKYNNQEELLDQVSARTTSYNSAFQIDIGTKILRSEKPYAGNKQSNFGGLDVGVVFVRRI